MPCRCVDVVALPLSEMSLKRGLVVFSPLALALGTALGGCRAPAPKTQAPARPVAPADATLPEEELEHRWVSPKPNRCPDVPFPAPGQVSPQELAAQRQATLAMRPALQACGRQFLDRHPFTDGGTIRVTIVIDCEGEVTRVTGATRDTDRAFAACVMRTAVLTAFNPPSAGIGRIQLPVTFHAK